MAKKMVSTILNMVESTCAVNHIPFYIFLNILAAIIPSKYLSAICILKGIKIGGILNFKILSGRWRVTKGFWGL